MELVNALEMTGCVGLTAVWQELVMAQNTDSQTPVYRPRNPRLSPFFRLVQEHFDEFERIYPQKYEKQYGFWRPIISIYL